MQKDKKYWIYVRSLDEWIEVPKEIYDEHNEFHDRFRHRISKRGQCVCPRQKWWFCDADCDTCPYYRRNENVLSLDEPIKNNGEGAKTYIDILTGQGKSLQDTVADRMLLELALQFAHEADPLIEQAIHLWQKDSSLPVIAVAKIIGIPYMTLCNRLDSYRNKFKKKYSQNI